MQEGRGAATDEGGGRTVRHANLQSPGGKADLRRLAASGIMPQQGSKARVCRRLRQANNGDYVCAYRELIPHRSLRRGTRVISFATVRRVLHPVQQERL